MKRRRLFHIPTAQRDYYWVVAQWQGRLIIIGPKDDERQASDFGFQKLDCPFSVVALPTRDKSRASSLLKARRLEHNDGLDKSMSRSLHQAPGEYTKPWWKGGNGHGT